MSLLLRLFEHHLVEMLICVFTLGGLSVSGVVTTVGRSLAPVVIVGGLCVAGYFWRDRLNDVLGSASSTPVAVTTPAEAEETRTPVASRVPPPTSTIERTPPTPERVVKKVTRKAPPATEDTSGERRASPPLVAPRSAYASADPASCPTNRRGLSGTCYAAVPSPYVSVGKVGSFCFDPFGATCH